MAVANAISDGDGAMRGFVDAITRLDCRRAALYWKSTEGIDA